MMIDAHQHFWKFNPERDLWITDEMAVIKRDFLPADLAPVLKENSISGCVAIQASESETENTFLLAQADQYDFIKGVVGWVDLLSPQLQGRLEYYSQHPKMKGFRHILQNEKQRDFMLTADFKKGIELLQQYNFTYDILIHADQLMYTAEFVSAFPDQPFVTDHLAKPNIKGGDISEWKKGIYRVAQYENVFCKVSGITTQAHWQHWRIDDFKECLDTVVEAFGVNRLMFGSDWPVCLLAGSYAKTIALVHTYFDSFAKHEKDLLFGGTAKKFYNL